MDNSELIQRFNALASDRTVVESKWEEVEQYVTPYRGDFFKSGESEGSVEWDRYGMDFDSTAVMAHQNLAASLHGSLTSPSVRWFEMRFRDSKLNEDNLATKWLQDVSDLIYYELQDSNFNLEINETYQDLCGFGTAVLTLEEGPGDDKWNGLNFSAVPLKEVFFEVDHLGRVMRFYRQLYWTAGQIISKFGEDVPESIKDLAEKGSTEKQQVIYAIFPRGGRTVPVGEKRSPSKRPLIGRYVLAAEQETLGKDAGYYEMPAYVARWRTTSGSNWGNSPAMLAMGDIKSLNTQKRQILVATEKRIDPPVLTEDRAAVTDVDFNAGAISVVRDVNGFKIWESGYDIYATRESVNDLRDAIKEYFFSNDLAFPSPQGTPMSATEAQIRYELMQRLLGPTLGRLESDLLVPLISRAFKMLARDGRVPEPPQAVIESDPDFDVMFIGPLARAQRAEGVAAIERVIGFAMSNAELSPDIMDNLDLDEALRAIGRALSVPAETMTDKKLMERKRKARAEKQAAMEEAQLAQQQGEAAQANVMPGPQQ